LKLAFSGLPLSDAENALTFALKYKFVTEKTSLVVLKENLQEENFITDEDLLMNDIDSSFPLTPIPLDKSPNISFD
jgi:hypothetical protein